MTFLQKTAYKVRNVNLEYSGSMQCLGATQPDRASRGKLEALLAILALSLKSDKHVCIHPKGSG